MLKTKTETKNKSSDSKLYKLDEPTQERLKDIARFLEYSEGEVIRLLINQYYKMQVIEHRDEDGYLSMEFIPFFETRESYKKLKDDYEEEFESEYPAIIIDRNNYDDYIPPQ